MEIFNHCKFTNNLKYDLKHAKIQLNRIYVGENIFNTSMLYGDDVGKVPSFPDRFSSFGFRWETEFQSFRSLPPPNHPHPITPPPSPIAISQPITMGLLLSKYTKEKADAYTFRKKIWRGCLSCRIHFEFQFRLGTALYCSQSLEPYPATPSSTIRSHHP